jgi:arabinose-5-phosphate isomerase
MTTEEIIKLGKEVVETEIKGLTEIVSQMDERFAQAVEYIAALKGKVILSGIGKSGIIAKKIASTMVSLGTPAIFMHPVDGLHGDLGAITPGDIAIVISNSGTTNELTNLLPSFRRLDIRIIAITGNPASPLARESDIVLPCSVEREACNLGLAPTASTTAQLALGDALAVVVSSLKGFDRDDFKAFHPGGELGRQLMSRIDQIMITGARVPLVDLDATLEVVLQEMTEKALGFTLVGDKLKVAGIVTDGDLRRALLMHKGSVASLKARNIMSHTPKVIEGDKLALDALDMMERYQITSLIVIDKVTQTFCGVVHLHDLLGRGNLALKGI